MTASKKTVPWELSKAPKDGKSIARFAEQLKGTSFGTDEWLLVVPFFLLVLVPVFEAVFR